MKDLKQYFYIDEECCNKPFEIVIPYKMKRNNVMGKSISTNEKMAIVLSYLITGMSFTRPQYKGGMEKSTVSMIVQLIQ